MCVLLFLFSAFNGAFERYSCMFALTVHAFLCGRLATLVIMALSCALRARVVLFFALVAAVVKFIAFVALKNRKIFFNVDVVGRDNL